MPHKDIFCSVPWTNLHIYWDGGFGVCCCENVRAYNIDQTSKFNIKNMSVGEWYNSHPIQKSRLDILGDKKLPMCKLCYAEESVGYESRRIKENFKTVIFTEYNLNKSFEQSPARPVIDESGKTTTLPIDWHVDFGNECNLACKMCYPRASSKIASQYKHWGMLDENKSIFVNWTENEQAWNNFLKSVDETKNLNRLHFMGGEPLLNRRFEPLLDYLIDKNRNKDVSISFVTNGTLYRQSLIDKLKKFKSCDIEVSLESFDRTNDYIRQGSKYEDVIKNVNLLMSQTNSNFNLVMRAVPQLLNVNSYHNYIRWCLKNRVSVQGIVLQNPDYLQIRVLPLELRKTFLNRYLELKNDLQEHLQQTPKTMFTGRDTSRLELSLLRETESIINLLNQPCSENVEEQRKNLVAWLQRWDKEYNLNALDYYPEYAEFLTEYGYGKI